MSLPWSDKGTKATPVNADELLILDSADANLSTKNKRITIGSLGLTGSLNDLSDVTITTPSGDDLLEFDFLDSQWKNRQGVFAGITGLGVQTEDLNMGSLNNIILGSAKEIRWVNSDRRIFNSSLGFVFEVETGDFFKYQINTVDEYIFDATQVDFVGNNLVNVGLIQFADVNTTLSQVGTSIHANVATGGTFRVEINSVNKFLVTDSDVRLNGSNLRLQGGNIEFDTAGNFIEQDGNDLKYEISETNGVHEFLISSNQTLSLTTLVTNNHNRKIINVTDPTNPQDVVTKAFGDATYGGGSQTPILQDIDFDGFDIKDISNVEFRETTEAPAGTVQAIYANTTGMFFNVPTADQFLFGINDINEYSFGVDDLDMQQNGLFEVENIVFAETLGAPAGTAHTIYTDTGGIKLNVPTADDFQVQVNAVTQYTFGITQFDLKTNNVINVGVLSFTDIDTSLQQDTLDLQIDVATGGSTVLRVNDVSEYSFSSTQADFNNNDLINASIDGDSNTILNINETQMKVTVGAANTVLTSNGVGLVPTYQAVPGTGDVVGPGSATDNAIARFDTATGKLIQNGIITIDDDANAEFIRSLQFTSHTLAPLGTSHIALVNTDFHINTTTGNNIRLLVDDVEEYMFDATSANFNGNLLNMGATHIQITAITSPGVSGSANVGRLFLDSGNSNVLSIIRNGSVIDLETPGEVFTWTANHLADGNDLLLNGGNIQFNNVLTRIGSSGTNLEFDVADTAGFVFEIDNTLEFTINQSSINAHSKKIISVTNPTNPQDVVTKAFGDANYGGGALQTPILQNVDYDNFSMTDVDNIQFDNTGSIPAPSVPYITSDPSSLTINASTGDNLFLTIGANPQLSMDGSSINAQSNVLENVGGIEMAAANTISFNGGTNTQTIVGDVGGITLKVPTADDFDIQVNSLSVATIALANANFNGQNATQVLELEANHTTPTSNQIIGELQFFDDDDAAARTKYSSIRSVIHTALAGDFNAELILSTARNGIFEDYIILNDAGDKRINLEKNVDLNGGNNLFINGSGTSGLIDFLEISTPANPGSNRGKLYVKDLASVTTLFFKDNSGTETNLLAAGATSFIGFTADADLDMGSFDIQLDASQTISFDGATATQTIGGDAGGIKYDVPTGDSHTFRINGVAVFALDGANKSFEGGDLTNLKNLRFNNAGTSSASDSRIFHTTASMFFNVPTADTFSFGIQGVSEYDFSATAVDWNGNNITDMGALGFDGAGTTAGNAVANIFSDAGGITVNVPTSDTFDITINGSSQYLFDANQLQMNGNTIINSGHIQFNAAGGAPSSTLNHITTDAGGMLLNVPSGDTFDINVFGTSEYEFTATIADWNSNSLREMGTLSFSSVNRNITSDSNGLIFNTQTSENFNFQINSVSAATIASASAAFHATNATQVLELEANHTTPADAQSVSQIDSIDDSSTGVRRTYSEIRTVIQSPANAAEQGELFLSVIQAGALTDFIGLNEVQNGDITFHKELIMQSADKIRLDGLFNGDTSISSLTSNVITLEAGGDDYTFSTAEANWAANSLVNLAFIESTDATPATAGFVRMANNDPTNDAIGWRNAAGSNNVLLFVDPSDILRFRINGSDEFTMNASTFNVSGNDIDNIQNTIFDLSTSGTDVDFTEDQLQEISISANTTFTGVNYATGKSKILKITTDGTLRTLAFPSGWVFMGTKPADQAASKVGILSLTCFTGAEAGVIAVYNVEA